MLGVWKLLVKSSQRKKIFRNCRHSTPFIYSSYLIGLSWFYKICRLKLDLYAKTVNIDLDPLESTVDERISAQSVIFFPSGTVQNAPSMLLLGNRGVLGVDFRGCFGWQKEGEGRTLCFITTNPPTEVNQWTQYVA